MIGWKARVNDPAIASFRYRVAAPIGMLQQLGHETETLDERHLDRYRTAVFSKTYGEKDLRLAERLKHQGCRIVLDLCDNHLYNPSRLERYEEVRRQLLAMIAQCDAIVCTTPILARTVQAEAGLATRPSVVGDIFEDVDLWSGGETGRSTLPYLLWFGVHGSPNAPSGMNDLMLIKDALEAVARQVPFELVVCSNSREKFDALKRRIAVGMRYVEWSSRSFSQVLAGATAVVLPLSENPFVACKTHNRLSTALSAGIPVIADPLEAYLEFAPYCALGNWQENLLSIVRDPSPWHYKAASARDYLLAFWSSPVLARGWETALGLPPTAFRHPANRARGTMRWLRNGYLHGTAHDPSTPDRPPIVELMINGQPVERVRCDLPHPANAGIPAGRGFAIPIARHPPDGAATRRCTLRIADTHQPVFGTFLDVDLPGPETASASDPDPRPPAIRPVDIGEQLPLQTRPSAAGSPATARGGRPSRPQPSGQDQSVLAPPALAG